ncbi:MAG: LacI family DNA-binding transcriptional regulator [Novosphingobium sp.]
MDDIKHARREASRTSRRGGTGPTVADVARAAGVSPMTVSRVVNNEARVLPATREKVLQAVEALGYVPNAAARSLAGQGQCRITLLFNNPSAAFMSALLMGCLAQSRKSDVILEIEPFTEGEPLDEMASRLARHRVDGVLLPGLLCDDPEILRALSEAGLEVGRIAATRPSAIGQGVGIDDETAAHAITAHLVASGHTQIGYINGPPQLSVCRLRQAGYNRALREAGLHVDPAHITTGDFSYRSGLSATEALLALPEPPTAIFAANDDMAAAVISVAHRQGLDVPGGLSVCGFDDTLVAQSVWPELTTISQPVGEMAAKALVLLVEAIGSKRRGMAVPAQLVKAQYELVRRDSVGPPKS